MLDVSSNVREVLGFTARLSRQFPFAVAKALTDTVREVAAELPPELDQVFEGGAVPFTRSAFFTQRATKDRLVAAIGIKDKQAEYLRYQIRGGTRSPKRQALRLPAEVDLTPQGNLPPGLIGQLVRRAKAGKRATKTQAARFGVSQALDLFYGEPGDGRPAGIYKRVVRTSTEHQLVPVVVFPKQAAKYEPRFDFEGQARVRVLRKLPGNLRRAWTLAQATAR